MRSNAINYSSRGQLYSIVAIFSSIAAISDSNFSIELSNAAMPDRKLSMKLSNLTIFYSNGAIENSKSPIGLFATLLHHSVGFAKFGSGSWFAGIDGGRLSSVACRVALHEKSLRREAFMLKGGRLSLALLVVLFIFGRWAVLAGV